MQIKIVATGEEGQHNVLFPQTSFSANGPNAEWLEENGCEEVVVPPPLPYVPTYRDLRAVAYAPLQEQLDMQYRDRMNGTTEWLDHITSIKTSIPKA